MLTEHRITKLVSQGPTTTTVTFSATCSCATAILLATKAASWGVIGPPVHALLHVGLVGVAFAGELLLRAAEVRGVHPGIVGGHPRSHRVAAGVHGIVAVGQGIAQNLQGGGIKVGERHVTAARRLIGRELNRHLALRGVGDAPDGGHHRQRTRRLIGVLLPGNRVVGKRPISVRKSNKAFQLFQMWQRHRRFSGPFHFWRTLTHARDRASWSSWGAAWALSPGARSVGSFGGAAGGGVPVLRTTTTEELPRDGRGREGSRRSASHVLLVSLSCSNGWQVLASIPPNEDKTRVSPVQKFHQRFHWREQEICD